MRGVAFRRILLLIGGFLETGSRKYLVERVVLLRRAQLSAACFGSGSKDRFLKATTEYGGYPMSVLKFS